MFQVSSAGGVGTCAWCREEFTRVGAQQRSLDILEDIAFSYDSASRAGDIERVAGVIVPHVVDSVEQGSTCDLWRAT